MINPEGRSTGGDRSGMLLTGLIAAVVSLMVVALLALERRSDAARDAEDGLTTLDVTAHELDTLSIELLRLPDPDPDKSPLDETAGSLKVEVDDLLSEAFATLEHLADNPVAASFVAPLAAGFESFDIRMEQALEVRHLRGRAAGAQLQVRRVDPAIHALLDLTDSAASAARGQRTSAERLKDVGSTLTLVLGGLALTLLSVKASRARQRYRETAARSMGLEQSERRYQSLMASSSDLVTVLDRDGRVTFQSTAIEHLLGWTPDDVIGRDIREFLDPEDARGVEVLLRRVEKPEHARQATEWNMRRSDGGMLAVEAVAVAKFDAPDIGGILVNIRDLSERLALEEALRHQAFHDPLTKLANRVLFEDRMEHALDRTVRSGRQICVLLLDLDFFKDINDSYGHAAGDDVLIEVAHRLSDLVRPEDTIARLGGDEFAILIEDVEEEYDSARVAERIIAAVAEPTSIGSTEVFVRASIGIVTATAKGRERGGPGREQILVEADLAMYEAKRQGRGQFQFFAPAMQEGVRERLAMKSDLERGIARSELILHYQPIVSIHTGDVVGVEALVRWQHPDRGLVPPMDFIPIAEQTGLIVELGRWVLREACREAAGWPVSAGDQAPYVSVNVSGFQLHQPSFVREVEEALRTAGLEPHRLVLEVTETALIEDTDQSEAKLQQLRRLGVRLAIDDFGTGYSSLSYLRRFNLDILKIDKSFVDGLGHGSKESALVSAMVAMGTSLSMKIVAEGIEDAGQLKDLRDLHCDLGQGFLFARPVPASELAALIAGSGEHLSGLELAALH